MISYLSFVHKINLFNDAQDKQFQPRFSSLACPRYLIHMKAYHEAANTLSELETRAKLPHKTREASLRSKEVK